MTQQVHHRRRRDDTNPTERTSVAQSFKENPALLLLLVFNLVITGLAVAGIAATNHRAAQAAETQEDAIELNRKGILFVCQQLEHSRLANAASNEASALHHGYTYTIPGETAPPTTPNEIEKACAEFRKQTTSNGPITRGSQMGPLPVTSTSTTSKPRTTRTVPPMTTATTRSIQRASTTSTSTTRSTTTTTRTTPTTCVTNLIVKMCS